MNMPQIILGVVMICVSIFIVIQQIKWFKKGLKDQFGYKVRLLLSGFALTLGGIIIIVKSF
jgi:hypothetical protein